MELAVESLETPALTKAQLAELLFDQIGLNKRESKDMIDAFFDLITDRRRDRGATRAQVNRLRLRRAGW
jgi:integration host factor subunit alpha